ncbi:hypothetical protein F7Q95_11205 [Pseudomonas psychrophila]|nr:hypothetical protein F7Q95_11205 [Pseudomonas psychrophila]
MRFIRMMRRKKGTREKMWAGQTAPFFLPEKTQESSVLSSAGSHKACHRIVQRKTPKVINLGRFALGYQTAFSVLTAPDSRYNPRDLLHRRFLGALH